MRKKFTMLLAALLACAGVAKADVPFTTSTAPSGTTWDANTTWYFIQFPNSDAYHTGGYLAVEGDGFISQSGYYNNVSNGYLLLTQTEKPIKNSALWCIVGDEESGFKFYNKMNPALVLGMDANNKARMYLASETKDGVSYAFDYAASTNSKEGLEDCATFRIHGSENKYWNNFDGGGASDYLSIWDNGGALADNGSAVRLTEVTEYELAEMATALPEVSTESSKKYYLIRNMRSGKYATYTGDATQLQHNDKTLADAQIWYFTADGEGYKLGNRATENKYAGTSSFTTDGVTVYVKVNPYCADYLCVSTSSTLSGNCWDASNNNSNIGTWNPRATDFEGTSWILEPLDYSAELSDLISEIEAAGIVAGENIGSYTEATVNALTAALTTAKALDDAGTATAEDVATLQAAYDALSINLPEEGKFYTITNQATDRSGKTALTIEANGGLKGVDATAMDGIFQFVNAGDNAFYLYSVERGTYLSTAEGHGTQAQNFALATETSAAKSVALSRLADGVVGITPNGGAMLHVESWYGSVVGWNETAATKASAWVISEPEYELSHTLSVGEAGWSTIVLGYNTTIPTAEGFKAYTIASQENGYVMLEEATGVLGANVPVLVNAPTGDYEFAYTTEAATVTASGLAGTLYNKNITAEAYVLSKVNDVVGLYKAKLTDGAFLNNANKAYYVPTNGSAAPMFSLERGEGTTSIDKAQLTIDNVAIYDLTGRRVEKMEKGIYIVNGKKIIK